MKIRAKLVILFLSISIGPILTTSLIAYITISNEIASVTISQLTTTLDKQEQRLSTILQSDRANVVNLTNKYELLTSLQNYLSTKNSSDREVLSNLLNTTTSHNSDILSLSIADFDGNVVVSTEGATPAAKLTNERYFTVAQKSDSSTNFILAEDKSDQQDKLYITSKVVLEGKPLGIILAVFSPDKIISMIKDYTDLGESGETVLTERDKDGNNIVLTQLRFKPDAAFTTKLNSLQQQSAVDRVSTNAVDYRGHIVLAATRLIELSSWNLTTKIDRDEAFAPVVAIRNLFITIIFVAIFFISFAALYLARMITKPLIKLTAIAQKISAGDLSQQAQIQSRDEVGLLSSSFNQMVQSLKSKIKEVNDERQTLETLLDNLPVGVFVVKAPNGEPLILNRMGAAITGRTLEGNTKMGIGQYSQIYGLLKENGSTYPEEELPLTKTLRDGEPAEKSDIYLRKPDGHIIALRVLSAPIFTDAGKMESVVVVFQDETEERNLNRSKDEFFSIASHELRTPLTAIKGNTSMIQQFYADKLNDPELKEMVIDIHESSSRLIEIVNDFLDMSRLEQGKMEFKRQVLDIAELINSVIREYQVTGSQRNLSLEFKGGEVQLPKVYGDSGKVKQVLINLIGNGLKFTEQGGVTVTSQLLSSEDGTKTGYVKVFVSDTGRGIPIVNQSLLFRKFQQAGSSLLTRDTTKGTGLGLYISKLIIEGMGGQIKLEGSVEGKGTTFGFTLPIATDEQLHAEATTQATKDINEAKIDISTGITQQKGDTTKSDPTTT